MKATQTNVHQDELYVYLDEADLKRILAAAVAKENHFTYHADSKIELRMDKKDEGDHYAMEATVKIITDYNAVACAPVP